MMNKLKIVLVSVVMLATSFGNTFGQTTTDEVTLLGYEGAGLNATGGVFVGTYAGQPYFGSSDGNTLLGFQVGLNGSSSATRTNNVFLGKEAGINLNPYSTSINENTIIGSMAGANSTIGNRNILLGFKAAYSTISLNANNIVAGYSAGYNSIIGAGNNLMSFCSGRSSNITNYNSLIGYKSGMSSTMVNGNVLHGYFSGYKVNMESYNTLNGYKTGYYGVLGGYNVMSGANSGEWSSGYGESQLSNSVFIGLRSGYHAQTSNSIFIGQDAGNYAEGENNLYIGNGAGSGAKLSNKLVIHNDVGGIGDPLIEGDFANQFFNINGKIGVNIAIPEHELDVNGTVRAQELVVEVLSSNTMNLEGELFADKVTVRANGNTADFVFEENYELKDLSEVEAFIKENKHLPEIPSAEEMEEQGVNLAEMNKLLLQKVEELTLYAIEKEKEVKSQKNKVEKLEERLENIELLLKAVVENK